MRQALIEDSIRRGLGRAAAAAGAWCDAYRPHSAHTPLASGNRFLRLPAIFSPASGFSQPVGYGVASWTGLFDAATTRPGDILVRPPPAHEAGGAAEGGIWFIAAQQPLLPVLCVRATRMVSFHRPAPPSALGLNPYGGVLRGTALPLATDWPASVLNGGGGGLDLGELPADAAPAAWAVLLPPSLHVALRATDLMADDLGRAGVVAAAERTDLGWRLQVRQTTT
jgi:hypothetical protein